MRLIMKPDEVAAERADWLEIRRRGLGASEISIVLGLAPERWGRARSLWDEKATGTERPDRGNMKRGRKLEPFVIEEWFEQGPALPLRPGGLYASDDRPWQLATFDALTEDGRPVQCKTSPTGIEYRHGLADYYRVQAYQEMDVAGAASAFVAALALDTWRLTVWELRRTPEVEADLAFMREEAEAFLASLAAGDRPEVDWTPACRNMLATLNPPDDALEAARVPVALARRRARARAAVKAAERRLALADNQLRERMGGARRAVARDPVTGGDATVVTRVTFPVAAHWRKESARDYLRAGNWGEGQG